MPSTIKNQELIASNLQEAIGQLKDIVTDLSKNKKYPELNFKVSLEHAYHHINFAWHIRKIRTVDAIACAEENFKKWSKFPVGEIDEYGSDW